MSTTVYWLVLVGIFAVGFAVEHFPLPESEFVRVVD